MVTLIHVVFEFGVYSLINKTGIVVMNNFDFSSFISPS